MFLVVEPFLNKLNCLTDCEFSGRQSSILKGSSDRVPHFIQFKPWPPKYCRVKFLEKYKIPNDAEKIALNALVKTLETCSEKMSPEEIQTLIYSTGKENGYAENLRDWFKLIYEVVFGDENGPRMGFFISFFGLNETKELILSKIK